MDRRKDGAGDIKVSSRQGKNSKNLTTTNNV